MTVRADGSSELLRVDSADPYDYKALPLLRFLGSLAGVYAQDKPDRKRHHRLKAYFSR